MNNYVNLTLGEGVIHLPETNSVVFVDITECKIIILSTDDRLGVPKKIIECNFTPSKLIPSGQGANVYVVGNNGLYVLSTSNFNLKKVIEFDVGSEWRTNDAGVDEFGNLWIGVMKSNEDFNGVGYIIIIDSSGKIDFYCSPISIPNLFAWDRLNKAMVIADSDSKILYRCFVVMGENRIEMKAIINFQSENIIPDGGFVDSHGRIYFAAWGRGEIFRIDKSSNKPESLFRVPSCNVTSIFPIKEKYSELVITSAEEKSEGDIRKPGKVYFFPFEIDFDLEIFSFELRRKN
ncbi:MAG: SMP-30/gluconolactonase/LRE family protein [Gammaproteobacteria bacterium]|nr:SMP-30/gluconolactonase/LRE family protein [Gammaproteobacteria bacterium]